MKFNTVKGVKECLSERNGSKIANRKVNDFTVIWLFKLYYTSSNLATLPFIKPPGLMSLHIEHEGGKVFFGDFSQSIYFYTYFW